MAPRNVTIDGTKYKVTENMGYMPDVGSQVLMVERDGKECAAVRRAGKWWFWTARDRTVPLREAVARGWPEKNEPPTN